MPHSWPRVREVFEGALALPAEARRTYIAKACGGDEALRRQVEVLLDSHDRARTFLETPPAPTSSVAMARNLEGDLIGPYHLAERIGAGGMGEVYKARDTRLNRTVAIKILPARVAGDPQARERFEREARAVAALNHPNICTLHDIGHHGGIDYLVMEYLDGETLAACLARGAVPLGQALQYALQIASALDKAHRAGIVHRDLKPANVMLTKTGTGSARTTQVKLLDFGLARTSASIPANPDGATQLAPSDLTTPGMLVGTVQYMAPEQIEGKPIDTRTDIFAFGLVLFEMLTGRKAFKGDSDAGMIAAILERNPPPLSSLIPMAPQSLEHVLQRCLAKDPDDRWQTARDLMLELESANDAAQAPTSEAPVQARFRRREWFGWLVAAGLALTLIVVLALRSTTAVERPQVSRMSIVAPEGTTFIGGYAAPYLAISPDGRRLALVPTHVGTPPKLWVRDLDSLASRALTGTDGATFPFWSPDGRSIAFFADGKLKTVASAGGVPQVVCDAPDARGGAWGGDDVIVFAPQLEGPLYRVSASGGRPAVITTLDASRAETSHRLPSFLPDGRHFVFLVQSGRPENSIVRLAAVDSNERQMLNVRASKAIYAGGFLFFARDRALVAQPFDTSALKLTGEPIPLGDQVTTRGGVYGDALFSVAANGTLAYWNGGPSVTRLEWFDRQGRPLGSVGRAGDYLSLDLSPDEKRVAAELIDPTTQLGDIWLIDVESSIASRFTSDPGWDFSPLWSPEGSRIVFGSIRGGLQSLYVRATTGRATDESFLKSSDALGPADWSATTGPVVFQNMTKFKIGVVPLAEDRTSRLVLQSDFAEAAGRLSRDGRWLAYTSNESGTWEVYVQPFPALDRKWRVSPDGGSRPAWRRDGSELFYTAPDQRLMAVRITTSPSFTAGAPVALFPLRTIPVPPTQPRRQYGATAKGDRFIVNTVVEPAVPTPVTLVLNWSAAR